MNRILLLVAVFSFGYAVNDIVQETKPVIFPLQAAVAGMDYYDLKRDRDFSRAVESIIEDCYVDDDYISC